MAEAYAIMIWLKDSSLVPIEEAQTHLDPDAVPAGHSSFVFNPPALPRVQFAHYADREQAETALRKICEDLDAGKTTIVKCRHHTFAIPAHSVHYVAIGKGEAKRVSPR